MGGALKRRRLLFLTTTASIRSRDIPRPGKGAYTAYEKKND